MGTIKIWGNRSRGPCFYGAGKSTVGWHPVASPEGVYFEPRTQVGGCGRTPEITRPLASPLKKNGFGGKFGCHWLCQCRRVALVSTLAKPVPHFFDGLLRGRLGKRTHNPLPCARTSAPFECAVKFRMFGRIRVFGEFESTMLQASAYLRERVRRNIYDIDTTVHQTNHASNHVSLLSY